MEIFWLCDAFCDVATDAVAETPLSVALAAIDLVVESVITSDAAADVAAEVLIAPDVLADMAVEPFNPAESALDDAVVACVVENWAAIIHVPSLVVSNSTASLVASREVEKVAPAFTIVSVLPDESLGLIATTRR